MPREDFSKTLYGIDIPKDFLPKDSTREFQKEILLSVYDALCEKGYNPMAQIIGYILSEDPTYITTHKNARVLIRKIDRDDILKLLLENFISQHRDI